MEPTIRKIEIDGEVDYVIENIPNAIEEVRKIDEVLWNVKVELDKYFKKRKKHE